MWQNLQAFFEPSTVWLLLGVVMVLLEFVVPGVIILFFGLGAILTGLACLLFDLSLNTQLLFFMVTSVLLLLLLRRRLHPLVSGGGDAVPDHAEFNGATGSVTEAIEPPRLGKVLLHGSDWKARAEHPIPVGSMVEVIGRDNQTLTVKTLS